MARIQWLVRVFLIIAGFLQLHCRASNTMVYIRWCVTSYKETEKCTQLASQFNSHSIAAIDCIQGNEPSDCMSKILGGTADIIVLDSGLVYKAGKMFGMVPVLSEDYGSSLGTGYYAVAVTKKSKSHLTLKNLKNQNSCHSGIRTNAGWYLPMGYLKNQGYIKMDCKAGITSAGTFFNSSCAPDALSLVNDPHHENSKSLCSLCTGIGDKKCQENADEPYYGSPGAFTCMAKDAGDVAFLAHTAILEVIGSAGGAYGSSSDYELLCKTGTRKGVDEYLDCNLGLVPSNVLMTSDKKLQNTTEQYKQIFFSAQKLFGPTSTHFKMFSSDTFGKRDLIFSDKTVKLQDVGEKNTYEKWLGEELVSLIADIECDAEEEKAKDGAVSMKGVVLMVSASFILQVLSTSSDC